MRFKYSTILLLVLSPVVLFAQAPGVDDINNAAQDIISGYGVTRDLCYSIAALWGIFGGIRIYSIWNTRGHHENIIRMIALWLAALIFFFLVPFVIEGFFK